MRAALRTEGQRANCKGIATVVDFPTLLHSSSGDRVFMFEINEIRTILTVKDCIYDEFMHTTIPATWSTENINPETDFFALTNTKKFYIQGIFIGGQNER